MDQEDVAALQEKIKNMSPEELKEFQKKQCIFCHIVSGRVQAKKVFEDDKVMAILDINPANPGHILLLPKEHYSIMPQLPEDVLTHIFMVAKSLSNTALRALEATGTNIIVANGAAAGQKAQHFMVHIIPRKENDNLSFDIPQQKISDKELDIIREKLSKNIEAKAPEKKREEIPPVLKRLHEEHEKKIVDGEFKEIQPAPAMKHIQLGHDNAQKPLTGKAPEAFKKPLPPKKVSSDNKKKPKNKELPKKQSDSANLDDIARILGAK